MNRILIAASLTLFCNLPLFCMGIDGIDEDDISVPNIQFVPRNPRDIYNNDRYERTAEHFSQYIFPIDARTLNDEEFKKKLESINLRLWAHHLGITILDKDKNTLTATLHVVEASSATNSGQEESIPFHSVDIPLGSNNLEPLMNKVLIEKRLHQIQELALSSHFEIANALKNYRESVSFTDKMKFKIKHQVVPEIENDLAHHIKRTLALPIVNFIKKRLTKNPIELEEQELEILSQKLQAEMPSIKKILALNQAKHELDYLMSQATQDQDEIQKAEDEFINQFEQAAAVLNK